MSGFWRRVQRGQTKRFREIDLGAINPFGEGELADTPVAALGLQPGLALSTRPKPRLQTMERLTPTSSPGRSVGSWLGPWNRWMPACRYPKPACSDHIGLVQVKDQDGDAPGCGLAFDDSAVVDPIKVIGPTLDARIEQRRHQSRNGIDPFG